MITIGSRTYLDASAEFSADGLYRWRLVRRWSDGPTVSITGLNPSKAGADCDDHTIVKEVRFAELAGFGRLVKTNLAALVSTDPKGLRAVMDPVGAENDAAIERALAEADQCWAAWGALPLHPAWIRERARKVLAAMVARLDVHALDVTKNGHPAHPLMLPYVLRPSLYRARSST